MQCKTIHQAVAGTARAATFGLALVAGATGGKAETTIDWPTFGGSAQRTGYNAFETTLSTATVPSLKLHWASDLGNPTAGQPSLIRKVVTGSGTFDLLIVTLSAGAVMALDAATGNVIWTTAIPQTGFTCLGRSYNLGIGEPATIDVAAGRVYVVDGGGLLHALALSTGSEVSGYPIEVIDSANLAAASWVHFASPTLIGSNLYIVTAASCENVQVPYHGQVIRFDTTRQAVVSRFYPMGNDSSVVGGGLWGVGGVARGNDDQYLWIATGNTLPAPQNGGNAEKIVKLTFDLKEVAENGPILKAGGDLDFGSTPLLFRPTGCDPMLAAINKSGVMVVYDRAHFEHGMVQSIPVSTGSGSSKFFGMPAYDPVTQAIYVNSPLDSPGTPYRHGLLAFQVGAACRLSLLWQQTVGTNGTLSHAVPPTIANGVVWHAEGLAGQVAAFDAADGTPLWNSGKAIPGASYSAPLVVNGQMFVAGGSKMFAYGL